jgi:hypothetical protein
MPHAVMGMDTACLGKIICYWVRSNRNVRGIQLERRQSGLRMGMLGTPTHHDRRARGPFKTGVYTAIPYACVSNLTGSTTMASIAQSRQGRGKQGSECLLHFNNTINPTNGGADGPGPFLGKEKNDTLRDVFLEPKCTVQADPLCQERRLRSPSSKHELPEFQSFWANPQGLWTSP